MLFDEEKWRIFPVEVRETTRIRPFTVGAVSLVSVVPLDDDQYLVAAEIPSGLFPVLCSVVVDFVEKASNGELAFSLEQQDAGPWVLCFDTGSEYPIRVPLWSYKTLPMWAERAYLVSKDRAFREEA